MLSNIRIGAKLFGAFLLMLALMGAVGALALSKLSTVNGSAVDLATNWMPSVRSALNMKALLNRERVLEFKMLMTSDPAELATVLSESADKLTELQKETADYAKLISSPEERAAHESFKADLAPYMVEHARAVDIMRQGKEAEAKAVLLGESLRHYNTLRAVSDKLAEINVAGGEKAAQDAQATYKRVADEFPDSTYAAEAKQKVPAN